MNYDSITVHDLLEQYVVWSAADVVGQTRKLAEIESRIKATIIEESSVGEIEVKIRESEDELTAPKGSPDRIVTVSEQFICQTWIPEGKYALVKKETP